MPNRSDPRLFDKEYDITGIRELALSAVPQSVIVTDASLPDNPIIYANEAFCRLTGYEEHEIIGRNCNFLSGPDTSPATRAEMRAAIAAQRRFQGMVLNYRRDGTPFWNELTLVPLSQNNHRYYVGVQVDITERLALEQSLRESQKMEALGKLSGGIAHDFNNILALIMGNAELITLADAASPDILDAARDILEAAEGGSRLVSRMLQFARGQSGVVEDVDVNQLVADVVQLLQRTMSDAIRIETDLNPIVTTVQVDKTLFQTALVNLVVNARDAMPEGGVVRIATRRRANLGPGLANAVVVRVSDTGTGMDEATRARAFEPFFTTKETGRGTGLGLSMVYRFVRQYDGDATITSTPGQGTSVNLILPLPDTVQASIVPASGTETRILIVEDDAKLRKMLTKRLRNAGYVVDEAARAQEGIHLACTRKECQLVISDIRLGTGMSGIDLVAKVRAKRPGMPILLITGFSDELENPPHHIDGVPILRKPFRTSDLLNSVSQMLSGMSLVGK